MDRSDRSEFPRPRLSVVDGRSADVPPRRVSASLDEVAAELAASDARIAALLSTFPPQVREQVIKGIYYDGAGEPRTTFRMLHDAADAAPQVAEGPWPRYEDEYY